MFSPRSGRKPDEPFTVHIPPPSEDRPSWAKVAVLAGVGFVIGVAWPRLAGVRLGPSAPAGASVANAAAIATPTETVAPAAIPPVAPASPRAAAAGSSPVPAVALSPTPAAAAAAENAAGLTVSHGFVFACKGLDREPLKASECGKLPGLDAVVQPRLRSLADCAAAAASSSGFSGKAHVVVRADFGRGTLTAEFGRSQGADAPEALLACIRASLSGASLQGLAHDYPSYAVAYTLSLGAPSIPPAIVAAPSSPRPPAPVASAGAEGSSEVVWDVALVRDAPKTGKIVARLPRGTLVRLGSSKDGWYPVKFGDGFSGDGWVFRGAIGR